jgi:predicted transcriptional regulator
MPTTTVRVDEQTHLKLRELSCEMNVPMQDVLANAVEAFRRQHFLEMANIEYAALRADPKAWAEELEERRLWDASLLDDLEDDPYPVGND